METFDSVRSIEFVVKMGLPMRTSHCVMVSILLVAAISTVGGCKPSASDEAKAKQVASKALPGNPLVGIWKSQPGGKANDQPSTGLAMTFERDGTMQMTAQMTQTMGGHRSGFTWHCQGRYEFNGGTLDGISLRATAAQLAALASNCH